MSLFDDPFLFPRRCSIHRPVSNAQAAAAAGNAVVGVISYSGTFGSTTPNALDQSEAVIATGLPCNVASGGAGKATRPGGGLAADSPGPIHWSFVFPQDHPSLPLGTIKERDIIIDDLNDRYQVTSPTWTPLGYQVLTVKLMT